VGWFALGFACLVGGLLLGIGLYLALLGTFPGWWKDWILRPVVHVTPGVARLQGVTAIGLGASIVAIALTMFVSEFVGGLLVLVAIVAYVIGAALFAFSTWLSRRPAS
jgi:hypothetical protein